MDQRPVGTGKGG